MMAWVSHLPQLASTALAATFAAEHIDPESVGPGARDTTRLAASTFDQWSALVRAQPKVLDCGIGQAAAQYRECARRSRACRPARVAQALGSGARMAPRGRAAGMTTISLRRDSRAGRQVALAPCAHLRGARHRTLAHSRHPDVGRCPKHRWRIARTWRCGTYRSATTSRSTRVVRARLLAPSIDLDCGNSGTTTRLMAGVVAGCDFRTRFIGDASLSKRPMRRVARPLVAMGARVELEAGDGLPMVIHGGALQSISWHVRDRECADQERNSARGRRRRRRGGGHRAVALARSHRADAARTRRVACTSTARACASKRSTRSRRSTCAFLPIRRPPRSSSRSLRSRPAGRSRCRTSVSIPRASDSSASCARWAPTWRSMKGPSRAVSPPAAFAASRSDLSAVSIDEWQVPSMIDELPLLACVATRASGTTEIRGAAELRVKESDRIATVVSNLRAIGATRQRAPRRSRRHGIERFAARARDHARRSPHRDGLRRARRASRKRDRDRRSRVRRRLVSRISGRDLARARSARERSNPAVVAPHSQRARLARRRDRRPGGIGQVVDCAVGRAATRLPPRRLGCALSRRHRRRARARGRSSSRRSTVLRVVGEISLRPVQHSFAPIWKGEADGRAHSRAPEVTRHVSRVAQMRGVRAWVDANVREGGRGARRGRRRPRHRHRRLSRRRPQGVSHRRPVGARAPPPHAAPRSGADGCRDRRRDRTPRRSATPRTRRRRCRRRTRYSSTPPTSPRRSRWSASCRWRESFAAVARRTGPRTQS